MNDRSPRARTVSAAVLLAFLSPIVAYWVYVLLLQPSPHYEAIDPEYEYFLNSLAVFRGQPYTYVDHPGTPVEMIGTAILAASRPWLANRPGGFIAFQLQHPSLFLNLGYALLALLHLACMLMFFRTGARSKTLPGILLSAALATMYFAIQPYALRGSVTWSHNSFSFPLGTALLLWLYSSLNEAKPDGVPMATWIGLGLGTGILTAITIFLAAWAAGILVAIILFHWLRGLHWRSLVMAIVSFALSALAGFYAAVLPVIDRMGGFWRWIYGILSHQSNYLAVPKDQSMLARLWTNAGNLLQLLPALFIAMVITLALSVAALAWWRAHLKEQPALWAIVGGLAAQMLALTLVFLDRPLRAYYFLGVAAIVPVLAMAVFKLYENAPAARRWLTGAVSLAVLIGLVANSVGAMQSHREQAATVAATTKLVQQVIAGRASSTGRSPGSLMVLWMYGTYSPCWGLWFADQRAGNAFSQDIHQICPNEYELTGRVLLPNGRAPLQEVQWDIIFTCDRYLDNVLPDAPGAEVRHYPAIQWDCGNAAVVLNR